MLKCDDSLLIPTRPCLFLLHSPREVVRSGGGLVLVHQVLDDLAAVVHLVQVVAKHVLLAELEGHEKRSLGLSLLSAKCLWFPDSH